ncbi:MAG: UDP-N-acetylmuramoyl-L-alanine--D-glutamate ligase [Eubacterium sp.]|nr:UDP-N-acetylmuramoyl-L-alanine--D-glutamate ligase [Eubacterium sp.]
MFKNVCIAGAGKSGKAAAALLIRNGAGVTIFDQNKELDTEAVRKDIEGGEKVEFMLGDMDDEFIKGLSLFVISPGIPCDADFVNKVRGNNIPIWGEIELAYYFSKGTIAAITGTNGKTTTTTLVGEIFKAYKNDSIVVGNIGIPFTEYADRCSEGMLVAAEISSFQLETVHTFRPHVSAILNLTPDHLNRHYTFDNYARVKFDISMNQTEDDYAVLNYDDPEVRARENLIKSAKIIYFSRKEELQEGVFVKDGKVVVHEKGNDLEVLSLKDVKILGDHNVENVLAAVAITHYMGIPADIIEKVITAFQGVEHRIEYVRTLNGVKYYNDSKGTNPDAAIKGIKAMPGPTYLIGGGYDKKSEFDEWIEAFDGKVKALVLLGATKDKIAETAIRLGFNDIVMVADLKEAVAYCAEHAKDGDNVLLSPACASWDMFKSYEQRGELFKEYVNEL